MVEEYTNALKEILDGKWFTFENYEEMFNAAYKNHGDYGIPEKHFNNIDAKYMAMSIDDTIDGGEKRNNNMQVKTYIEKMRENVASILGITADIVNVKATTEERLGFTGEEKGISAHAVCLLYKK